MQQSQQEPPTRIGRKYIDVPYEERQLAKDAGARWDKNARSWFVPEGADNESLDRWPVKEGLQLVPVPGQQARSPQTEADADEPRHDDSAEQHTPGEEMDRADQSRHYLAVPYGEREAAKAAGARWDKDAKAWYVGAGADPEALQRWALGPDGVPPQTGDLSPEQEFAKALSDMGLLVPDSKPLMDGQPHRVPVQDDGPGQHSGFYVGHLDGRPAGFIQNHKTGVKITWKATARTLSPEEQAQLQAQAAEKQQQRDVERAQMQAQAAERVQEVLARAEPATEPTEYMQHKGIDVHRGVYVDGEGNTLVPVIDTEGKVWSIQTIDARGQKRFAKGSRKKGCFHVVGGLSHLQTAETLVIAEGYATAATASEVLQQPTVAAFDAGNLLPVAQALHDMWPAKPVLILGDDDRHQEAQRGANPGRDKAAAAARTVGGRAAWPTFAAGEQEGDPRAFSDFNDLAVRSSVGRTGALQQLSEGCDRARAVMDSARPRRPSREMDGAGQRKRTQTAEYSLPPENSRRRDRTQERGR